MTAIRLIEALSGARFHVDIETLWIDGSRKLSERTATMTSVLRQSAVARIPGGTQLIDALSGVSSLSESRQWWDRATEWANRNGVCLTSMAEATRFVHLRGIGRVPGILARELKPGHIISWHQSPSTHEVVSCDPVSPHYMTLKAKCLVDGVQVGGTTHQNGEIYTFRVKKDRLIAAKRPRQDRAPIAAKRPRQDRASNT